MSFELRCPQCLFVSRQMGQPTACMLHVSSAPGARLGSLDAAHAQRGATVSLDYDEPFAFGRLPPTIDRPAPFSVREYVRLQLFRCRIRAEA